MIPKDRQLPDVDYKWDNSWNGSSSSNSSSESSSSSIIEYL